VEKENKKGQLANLENGNVKMVSKVCVRLSYSLAGSSVFFTSSDAGTDASTGVSLQGCFVSIGSLQLIRNNIK